MSTAAPSGAYLFDTTCTEYVGWGDGDKSDGEKSCIRVGGRDYTVMSDQNATGDYDPNAVVVEYVAEVTGADSVTVEFTTDSGTTIETLPTISMGEERVELTAESGGRTVSQHGYLGWASAKYPMNEIETPTMTITSKGRATVVNCRMRINGRDAGVTGNAASYDAAQEPYKSTEAQHGVAVVNCAKTPEPMR